MPDPQTASMCDVVQNSSRHGTKATIGFLLAYMKKLALISALLLAASPVAAQVAMSNAQRSGGQSGSSASTQAPTTGVFCIQEMTATFCNVLTHPNTNGYGSSSVSRSSSGSVSRGVSAPSGGAGSVSPSIPPCPPEPPFNELCN